MSRPPLTAGAAAVLLASFLACASALAAPEARLWERWTAHEADSGLTVDHGEWDRLLKAHVRAGPEGVHRVDYRAIQGAQAAALDAYLADLQGVSVSRLSRSEQRAFWINLYNALTVKVVVDHYPVSSIRDIDISPGLFADGPWGAKLVSVEDERLSLDDIEHRILRPIWRDPRVHYAVNCASLGCPDLVAEAFTAENTERLLEEGARSYVNHPRGASLEGGALTVSSIYDWFQADFGGDEAGVIEHLRQYARPELAAALDGVDRIAGDRYDWSLNDVR